MLEPRPTRRDPRLLLLDAHTRPLRYIALDAWECRALGTVPDRPRTLPLVLAQLVLKVRPSVIAAVCLTPLAQHAVRTLARSRRLSVLVLSDAERRALVRRAPSRGDLQALYPELKCLPTRGFTTSLRLAVVLLMTRSSFFHRHYVSRLSARTVSSVDP